MKPEETARKNLDLHAEWMRYVFDHPEVLDRVPAGASLVILPTDDPALAAENQKTIASLRAQGAPVMIVRMKTPTSCVSSIEMAS